MPSPQVGVAVFIRRHGQILLGKRLGSHGAGTWATPGGHLEFGESLECCARREVHEETGLELTNLTRGPYTETVFTVEKKHYITIFMLADCDGEPKRMEPDKCEGWAWFAWDDLPKPLFASLVDLVRQGYNPIEAV